MTTDPVATEWLRTISARSYAQSTIRRHRGCLARCTALLGPLGEADDAAWQQWYDARSAEVSPETLAGELSVIRSALQWSRLASPRLEPPRRPRRLPRPLSVQDVRLLLTGCPDPERSMIVLMVGAGLRCMEVAGLQIEDLDLDTRRVTVMGKGARERTVPLSRAVTVALRATHWPRSGAAFRRLDTGSPYAPYLVSAHVGRRLRECGLPSRPHRLRHTYATQLAEAGMPVEQIMVRLGHSSPAMSLRYARITIRAADFDEVAGAAVMGRRGRLLAAV